VSEVGRAEGVLFHPDVGSEQGWGHFRECVAVGRELSSAGVRCGFALPSDLDVAHSDAASEAFEVHSVPVGRGASHSGFPAGLAAQAGYDFVVVNLVRIPGDYARELDESVRSWAVITEHSSDEVGRINFNISLNPELMPLDASWGSVSSSNLNVREEVREALVCLGGSDPKNATGLILEMLRQGIKRGHLPETIRMTLVIGPLFRHRAVLEAMAETYPADIRVVGPVTPTYLAQLAAGCDVAITTGGGTMYEFAALGLPSLVVPILDKMAANASVLAERNAVLLAPRVDRVSAEELVSYVTQLVDLENRRSLSQHARETVDGRGAARIACRLLEEWNLS